MASIYIHSSGKSPYYIAVFSDHMGKQRHRSTKTQNREQALAIAERYQRMATRTRETMQKRGETAIPGAELIMEEFIVVAQKAISGRYSHADARECLERFLEASGQKASLTLNARKYLEDWLVSKKPTVSKGTAESYVEKVASFLKYLESQGVESLDAVQKGHVEGYRNALIKSGIAKTTINLKLKMVSTAFREAQVLGHISLNPFDAVAPLPAMNAEREAFSLTDLRTLLSKADSEWKGMILVGASTGARIGDAASLLWCEIDLKRGIITYLPRKTKRKVGAKKQESIILPDLHKYLAELVEKKAEVLPNSPIFPNLSKKSVKGEHGLSLTFRALMDTAGVKYETLRTPEKNSKGRKVFSLGFHSLRHSCTSLMANIGVSQEIRKKLVGHKSNVHERYTHFENETYRKALKDFPTLL